jgi:KTSC domain-containing protein
LLADYVYSKCRKGALQCIKNALEFGATVIIIIRSGSLEGIMDRLNISSTNIKSAGYDPERQVLEIEFQGGAVYQYRDVPADIIDALRSAASPGKFFEASIKRAGYHFQRIA